MQAQPRHSDINTAISRYHMDKKLPKVSSINCDITMQPMTDGLSANSSQGDKNTGHRFALRGEYRRTDHLCSLPSTTVQASMLSNKRNYHHRYSSSQQQLQRCAHTAAVPIQTAELSGPRDVTTCAGGTAGAVNSRRRAETSKQSLRWRANVTVTSTTERHRRC